MYQKLPVGVDYFAKLREKDYYYVDKTGFISTLLRTHGEVNLFTRPRRFGKTLNMSMLQAYFEIGTDSRELFRGLEIEKDTALCEAHMNQYPVIFLTLKDVSGTTYEEALKMLAIQVSDECNRLSFLEQSEAVSRSDRSIFRQLSDQMAEDVHLMTALKTLCRMLHVHYGKKVILLVDEYDVPLDKAFHNGFYKEMIAFMRTFLGKALKTNEYIDFAVVTGCLRISKESIFTGLNNPKIDSIVDERYDEYFGFTDADVRKILADYDVSAAYEETRDWYDGYHFGDADVYCPWDVVNHVDKLCENPKSPPRAYWNNTSSNDMVRRFIDKADTTTRAELEKLVAGEAVSKRLSLDLTYSEIDDSINNLWSILFSTGYLTRAKASLWSEETPVQLIIPNREVRTIFIDKIQKWFEEKVQETDQAELYNAMWSGDDKEFTERIFMMLMDSISYFDYHENYYHAFLTGVLTGQGLTVHSNYETGKGRSGITVEDMRNRRAVLIETKVAESYDSLGRMCDEALVQIKAKEYAWPFLRRKYEVRIYGAAFYGKDCLIKGELLSP